MRFVLLLALVLAIAVGGGASSVWYALSAVEGLGAVRIGAWTAYPASGTPDVDPYSKARIARDASLPLGQAEGLAFLATHDSSGQPLRGACRYRIEGDVPVSRFWTLYAQARPPAGEAPQAARSGLHSRQILRRPDNSFEAVADRRPAPGNWLQLGGTGPFRLVLTLYDTPLASSADARDLDMPLIYRTGCDGERRGGPR